MARTKGAVGKITKETREVLKDFLQEYYASGAMHKDLAALDTPKERIDVFLKVASIITPRQTAVDATIHTPQLTIEQQLIELAGLN